MLGGGKPGFGHNAGSRGLETERRVGVLGCAVKRARWLVLYLTHTCRGKSCEALPSMSTSAHTTDGTDALKVPHALLSGTVFSSKLLR